MAAENAYKLYDVAYQAAPKLEPKPQKEENGGLKKAEKTQQEIRTFNEKVTNRKFIKIAAVVFSFLILYAVACHSFVVRDTAKKNYEAAKTDYAFSQAKNRELKVQLNQLVSAENIDRIAVEQLGLVKVTSGNEIYLDTSDGNKVIFSQNK